jgi:hypothetical protein
MFPNLIDPAAGRESISRGEHVCARHHLTDGMRFAGSKAAQSLYVGIFMNRDIDSLDSVFVPDLLTPTQYFDTKRRDSADDPLKRLMMAVLQDAIRCYQDGQSSRSALKRKKFYEVKDWFFDDSSDGPFSFTVVCEALNLLPDYLRFGLAQLQNRGKLRLGRRPPVLGAVPIISLTANPRSSSKKAQIAPSTTIF